MILDSEDENYWETAEAITNYEPEPKKDFHWDKMLQNEETKGINPDSDPKEEIYWDGLQDTKGKGMRTKNAHDTPVKDKEYEADDEQMRRAWDNIHASSTIDSTIRLNMATQNRRIISKKDLITKFILFSIIIGQATFAKEIGGMMVQNVIQKENLPSQYRSEKSNEDMSRGEIDGEIIEAYDCMEGATSNAEISLNPPPECRIEDGSAYQKPIRKRAQILEHVRKVPVEVTTCVVQWRVNVGWCGGEFAIESYMHADLETLRSSILPTEVQCNEAEPDGTITITTPEYGSIESLDLKLQLEGGVGEAMFQPSGSPRPDSWCKGYPFYPPKNTDDAIQYLDYRSHYERKEQWPNSKIRRAVVTYRLSAKVQKTKAYIIEEGQKLVVPNTLAITRNRNEDIEEILDNVHYKSVGGKRNINELESYEDVNIGRVVFNRTNLPRHKCEEYRSIAKIDNGELLQSKLERFAIYK